MVYIGRDIRGKKRQKGQMRKNILLLSSVLAALMALGSREARSGEVYSIENEKIETTSGMAAADKLGEEGTVKLMKIYEGDFVCRTEERGNVSAGVKKIGRIKIDFEVKSYKDSYAYRMNVRYGFPVKGDEPEIAVSKNVRGKISLERAQKFRTDIGEKPEEVERVVSGWVEEIIKQGEKNNYEYQPLFGSGNLKEALTEIGIQLVGKMPEAIEELIVKYPEEVAQMRARGRGPL
jgi:hypothetical protein